MPRVTQQAVEPTLESRYAYLASKPPIGSTTSPPSHPKPRNRGVEQRAPPGGAPPGMLEDGNDVAHHGHTPQLVHDLLVEVQQHALWILQGREGQVSWGGWAGPVP